MFWNNIARMSHKREVAAKEKNWSEDFCTECGDELEDFCFSNTAEDLEAIRTMFAHCKKKHKFTGGMCAKLFIASYQMSDTSPNQQKDGELL